MRGGVTRTEWSEQIGKLSLAKQCAFYSRKYKVINRTKNKGIDARRRLLLEKLICWKVWSWWIKLTQCGSWLGVSPDELKRSLDNQTGDHPIGFMKF